VPSAGAIGFVPNPTILYKFCSLYGGSLFIVGQRGARVFIASKIHQMSLKWESFAEDSFNLKRAAGRVQQHENMYCTGHLCPVARACLVHAGILLFSATQCL
jgi:hypothetical protein